MRQGLILFPKSTLSNGSNAFGWWRDEAAALGISLEVAFFEDIVLRYGTEHSAYIGSEKLASPDFVIMRGYSENISTHFESAGIPVFNRWNAMAASHNKLRTHSILALSGIPTPLTVGASRANYDDACAILGKDVFVVKQPDSSRGSNVFLVRNKEEYDSATASCKGDFLIQEYISASHGRDLRVWTVGDSAVACVLRHSGSSFLSNYSRGGSADPFDAPQAALDLAARAARAVGLDFAGVDLLLTADGNFTVCEVNGNAGFRTLSVVGGENIIAIFMKHIASKVYGEY